MVHDIGSKQKWLLDRLQRFVDDGDVLIFANQKARVDELAAVLAAAGARWVRLLPAMHPSVDLPVCRRARTRTSIASITPFGSQALLPAALQPSPMLACQPAPRGDVMSFAQPAHTCATCRTAPCCTALCTCRVAAIHGDMDQHTRMTTLAQFKAGDFHALVATDVAARGLDIKSIRTVSLWHCLHCCLLPVLASCASISSKQTVAAPYSFLTPSLLTPHSSCPHHPLHSSIDH